MTFTLSGSAFMRHIEDRLIPIVCKALYGVMIFSSPSIDAWPLWILFAGMVAVEAPQAPRGFRILFDVSLVASILLFRGLLACRVGFWA